MSNNKTVFFLIGILLIVLGLSMLAPYSMQVIYKENSHSFISSSIVTIFIGILCILANLDKDFKLNLRQTFLVSTLAWVTIAVFGSLPFVHYLAMTKGSYRDLIKDSQVRWFLVLLTILVLTIFSLLFLNGTYDWKDSIRYSAFNVTSILTGTGYGTADFGLWGGWICAYNFTFVYVHRWVCGINNMRNKNV